MTLEYRSDDADGDFATSSSGSDADEIIASASSLGGLSVDRFRSNRFLRRAAGWPVGPPEVSWGLGAAVGCFLFAQLLGGLWAGAVRPATALTSTETPLWYLPLQTAGLWFAYLGGAAVVSSQLGRGFRRDFEWRASFGEYALAAVVGVGAQLLAIPALYLVIGDLLEGDPEKLARELIGRADTPVELVALVVAVVVMAPLAEEVMFRGLLLPALSRRIGPLVGAVGISGVFALVHPDPVTFPGLFLFGLILAWLTTVTGRLGAPIVAHAAFNLTSVVLLVA